MNHTDNQHKHVQIETFTCSLSRIS